MKHKLIWIQLIVIVLQVVWPTLSFAEEKTFVPEETGWYYMTKKKAVAESETNDTLVHYYAEDEKTVLTPSKRIHYAKAIEKGYRGNQVQYFLNKDIVYYYDDSFGELKKASAPLLESLENMVSVAIFSLANGLHFIVSSVLGKVLTIDDLVFNKYSETSIDFFSDTTTTTQKSTLIYGTNGTIGLNQVMNQWYAIFFKITILVYMMMLVYMGIRIILSSTAQEKANFKRFIIDWMIGIALLFLFPYVMKHVIQLNNSFVKTIEANKGFQTPDPSYVVESDLGEFDKLSLDHTIKWTPDGDYMSRMGYLAQRHGKIAISICFLVLTWQFITLIFHYIKRVFMVAFLITIFPLVCLSYAVDKIADGKSQAFDTWFKEFILNVFSQSFHAIIYVFICTTIMSVTANDKDPDYLLAIVGVMFLFQGEQIIRQIFGQVSQAGTMKTLGENALATFAAFKMMTGVTRGVTSRVVGEKSFIRKGYNSFNILRADKKREEAFPETATFQEPVHQGERLPDAPEDPGYRGSQREKKNFQNQMAINDAIATLNNPKTHSKAEMAKALETVFETMKKDPDNPALEHCKLNKDQILAMMKVDENMQKMMMTGMTEVEIQNRLDAQLGVILETLDEPQRQEYRNTYWSHAYIFGPASLVKQEDVEEEVQDTVDEVNRIQASLRAIDWTALSRPEYYKELNDYANDMELSYADSSMSVEDREELRNLAKDIKAVNSREGGTTHSNLWKATRSLKETQERLAAGGTSAKDVAMRKMLTEQLHEDIDVFAHVYGRHLVQQGEAQIASFSSTIDEKDKAREAIREAQAVVDEYESDTRDGYREDEVSAHEVITAMTNNRTEEEKSKINFRRKSVTYPLEVLQKCTTTWNNYVSDICETYYGGTNPASGATVEETNAVMCLATLMCRDDGTHSEFELYDAAEVVQKQMESSEEFRQIVEEQLDENVDVIMRAISEKIVDETGPDGKMIDTTEDDDIAEEIAKRAKKYVEDTDSIVYDHTDEIIDRIFNERKEIVSTATSSLAGDYLIEHDIDLLEKHQNMTLLTQEGYTLEELKVKRKHDAVKSLASFSPINVGKEDDEPNGIFDFFAKRSFLEAEMERDGVRASKKDRRNMYNPFVSAMQMAEERRKQRDKTNNQHFTGDTGKLK